MDLYGRVRRKRLISSAAACREGVVSGCAGSLVRTRLWGRSGDFPVKQGKNREFSENQAVMDRIGCSNELI